MKLTIISFTCARCGENFRAPGLPFDSYGEFLLRSLISAEEAYLDALDDKTFLEVESILRLNHRVASSASVDVADLLQENYGAIACEPDRFGRPFKIGVFPCCPYCNSQEMSSWDEVDPPEFVEKNVEYVRHDHWASLTEGEKMCVVDKVISTSKILGKR